MKDLIVIIPVSSFKDTKSRLSPFLSNAERISLLKVMLKDIVISIEDYVDEIIIVSNDDNVEKYANSLNISFIKEPKYEKNHLNNALKYSIEKIKNNTKKIMIIPSDIPLIKEKHIAEISKIDEDFIIAPSKGGGTNMLCFNTSFDYDTLFGNYSFFKHLELSNKLGMSVHIYDSFYLSLDVNTTQDLGEILLHGNSTHTQKFLESIDINVESNHGRERLNVKRF